MTHPSESFPGKEKSKTEVLQDDFCGMFDMSKKAEAGELFKKIIEEYQAENRAYHSLEHIENLLSFVKEREKEISDLRGVKLAVWLHDVVYDTNAKDNEEKSAQFAQDYLEQLGIPKEIMEHVVALVQATARHEAIEGDPDSAIFLDGDLAILGSSEEEYNKYAAKIRKEYAWVPDEQYKEGRIKILENFLKRPAVYFTERAGKELEQQARRNMEREVALLS